MKLFLRDHAMMLVLYAVQLVLVLLVYMLDGFRNWLTGAYACFLSFAVLCVYLLFRYLTHYRYYKLLSRPMDALEQSIQPIGHSPVPAAAERLLREQYRHYKTLLRTGEHHMQEHLTFIHQWVHQMKTPLSVIHLTVQGWEDEKAASIRDEADKLDRGLETVMYAARLEAIEQDMQIEQVTLRDLADRTIHEHKRLFIRAD